MDIGFGGRYEGPDPEPFVTVNNASSGTISGSAPPNARIELFLDDDCPNCEGKTYVTTVLADSKGSWTYQGKDADKLVATATDVTGSTQGFSKGGIGYQKEPTLIPASCGRNNGAIKDVQILSGTSWYWEDVNGNVVGRDTSLTNVGAGQYRLVIQIGTAQCYWKSTFYQVQGHDLPKEMAPSITPADCGGSSGSIFAYADGAYDYRWQNSLGDCVGNTMQIGDLLPGTYFLDLSLREDTTCRMHYGPFVVGNQSGPTMDIDKIRIVDASCGNGNGQILGIGINNMTGSAYFAWLDNTGNTVSNNLDLQNVYPGKYMLVFKDQSACDTLKTPVYTVGSAGDIRIDETNVKVKASGCSLNNGSIDGLKVEGGSLFEWRDAGDSIVGKELDIDNMAPGSYRMTVSNSYGCTETSSLFTIASATYTPVHIQAADAQDPNCGITNNGFIRVNSFDRDPGGYTFWWVNGATGQILGDGLFADSLTEGSYKLLTKDPNGCEGTVKSYTLTNIAKPVLNIQDLQISNDIFSSKSGSIVGLNVEGGTGVFAYAWITDDKQTIGQNIDLFNVGKGTYQLTVEDKGCRVASDLLEVKNKDEDLPVPLYLPQTVQMNGSAVLDIKTYTAGQYFLYRYATPDKLLQENTSGVFTVSDIGSDTTFYIQRKFGACVSPVGKAEILVWKPAMLNIPTAFTPNGDGRNDVFRLVFNGHIRLNSFVVYNRWGQQVFRTNQATQGWSGTQNGQLCEAGTYVWFVDGIDLSDGTRIVRNGTVTLIR